MTEESQVIIRSAIRQDVVDVWGNNLDKILQSCQAHIIEALSVELALHQRYPCISCIHPEILEQFFNWVNKTGYKYVIEDWDYGEFISHTVRWAVEWSKQRMLSPCTDSMPSGEIH